MRRFLPIALLLSACQTPAQPSLPGPGQPTAWICEPLEKIFENALPGEKTADAVHIETARNEYESAQIAVRSPAPLKKLSVAFSEFPAGTLTYNFVGFVPVRRPLGAEPSDQLGKAPGRFPDLLLPDRQLDVAPDTTQPIWITLFTPKDTRPGTYRGEITVTAEGFQSSFPIQVSVWPVTIPEERHLYNTNWIFPDRFTKILGAQPYTDEFYRNVAPYFRAMSDHRQNMTWTSWHIIRIKRTKAAKLEFDYSAFDRFVEVLESFKLADAVELTHLGGRSNGKMGFHPLSITDETTGQASSDSSDDSRALFLSALQEHLRAKGWLKKTLVHVSDEADPKDRAEYRAMAAFVKRHAPEIRTIDAILSPFDMDAIDVPVPVLHLFHRWGLTPTKEMWYYTCVVPQGMYPNRLVQNRLIDTRLLHWINRRYGLAGYLHWAANYWNDQPFEDLESDKHHGHLPAGDMWIAYPGPLSSIRWEAMRDGLEDYELLWLLDREVEMAKASLGKAADEFDPRGPGKMFSALAVTNPVDHVRDPDVLRSLRRRIVRAIQELQSEPLLLVEASPGPETRVFSSHNLIAIKGVTRAGAVVRVNGLKANVAEDGRFWSSTQIRATSPIVQVTAERNGKQTTRLFSYWVSRGTGHTPDLRFGEEAPVAERDRMTWLYWEAIDRLNAKEYEKSAAGFSMSADHLPVDDPLRGSAAYNAACAYSLMGKADEGFAWLEKAIAYGWNNPGHAEADSDLDVLRKDVDRWKRIQERFKAKK